MGFFSSLIDSFTGAGAQKALDAANKQAKASLAEGRNSLGQYYGTAQNYLSPFGTTGQRANTAYADAIGANGQGGMAGMANMFAASDPYRKTNEDMTTQAIMRRYNAMGSGSSGAAQLAAARALEERGSQDYNNWLSRLGGAAQMGAQVAGTQAGLASMQGQNLAGMSQQSAANAINYGNATAANSNTLSKNLLSLGGLALSAVTGMPVGMGMGGGATQPGTAANGGWSTTTQLNNWFR